MIFFFLKEGLINVLSRSKFCLKQFFKMMLNYFVLSCITTIKRLLCHSLQRLDFYSASFHDTFNFFFPVWLFAYIKAAMPMATPAPIASFLIIPLRLYFHAALPPFSAKMFGMCP